MMKVLNHKCIEGRLRRVFLLTLILLIIPTTALAGPLTPITESDIVRSQPADEYSSINEILAIIFVILGFHTTAAFIVSTVLLAKSGASSMKRSLGFVSLGTALISGYLLTKAKVLAEAIVTFF